MMARFCIDHPIFASVLSIVIVLIGIIAGFSLPVDQYPDITPPGVSVSANFPGATADVSAEAVAAPLERQFNGIPHMKYLASKSSNEGRVGIDVTFEVGTDVDLATVLVQNKAKLAEPELPVDVMLEGVRIEQKSNVELMKIALRSTEEKYDSLYLSNYLAINVETDLRRIPGVGRTRNYASRPYSMRIWLLPNRLAAYGLTPDDVAKAVREQNAAAAAGRIGMQPNSGDVNLVYPITAQSKLKNEQEFSAIIIRANADGSMVRLGDVARVELGSDLYTLEGRLDAGPSAVLGIFLLPGANAIDVSERVRARLAQLEKRFPEGLAWLVVYDNAEFVSESISEVVHTLFEALVLVIIVVFLFLQNWRATLIPTLAVPVSLIGTFIFMYLLGFTLNTINMLGLVLVIGIVVDDAIVVVENVERLIKEENLSVREAAIKAMRDLSGALIATALVLVAAFAPVSLLPGISGIFYREFAVAITVAVALSAFVALTLSPALCPVLLRGTGVHGPSINPVFRCVEHWLEMGSAVYVRLVGWTLHNSGKTIGLFALMGLLAWWMMSALPSSFMPVEDKGRIYVDMELHTGSSVNRTRPVLRRAEAVALAHPAVQHVFSLAGENRRTGGNEASGSLEIILKPWAERARDNYTVQRVLEELRSHYERYPEIVVQVSHPPAIEGLGLGDGVDLVLQDLTGANWAGLLEAKDQVVQRANAHPVLVGVSSPVRPETPELKLEIDNERVKALGIPMKELYGAVRAYSGSYFINDFNLYGRVFRVRMQADDQYRERPEDMHAYQVRGRNGAMVPISAVAKVHYSVGPASQAHFNLFTAAVVSAGAEPGYSTGDAIAAMTEVLDASLPPGFAYEWTGLTREEVESGGQAVIAMGLAILFVYLFLCAQYESWTVPWAVLLITPSAVFGAVLAMSVRGLENNVFFQIALVALVGMTAKNAILIVEFARQLVEQGKDLHSAALAAAKLRFRPIMMTSIAFILGVIPLVISSGPGSVARHSIATAAMGGMLLATTAGILVVPMFFVLLGRFDRRLVRMAQSANAGGEKCAAMAQGEEPA